MKKYLLLFSLILSSQLAMAQCTADATVTTWGMHPLPSVDLSGLGAVPEPPATVNQSYDYTFSLVVPGSFDIPVVGTLGVTDAVVTSITGLPSGLMLGGCNTSPDCTIPGGTTGCFKIIGTPDASNAPGEYEITVNVTVNGTVVVLPQSVDLTFPPDPTFNLFDFPLDPYVIVLEAAVSNSNLLANELSMSENQPNPFSTTTAINVEAVKGGDYTFSVTNLLGEKIMDKEYNLTAGTNTIEFDGSNLSNGVYIYSLSSEAGVISKKMIVSK